MDEGSFQGQVAVVTGAASGIGRGVAERHSLKTKIGQQVPPLR